MELGSWTWEKSEAVVAKAPTGPPLIRLDKALIKSTRCGTATIRAVGCEWADSSKCCSWVGVAVLLRAILPVYFAEFCVFVSGWRVLWLSLCFCDVSAQTGAAGVVVCGMMPVSAIVL